MSRVALGIVSVLLAVVPADVAPIVERQGFYVEPGSSIDEAVVEAAVQDARFAGGNFHIIVLADEPPGGATVFADAVLNLLPAGGTVLVVAPETIGWGSVDDIYDRAQLDRATNAAFAGSTDAEVVQRFVAELTGEPVDGVSSSSGGGGAWILLLVVAGLIGLVVFIVWRNNKRKRERTGARLEAAKVEVQRLLDAVANDILDLEDEVAISGDDAVQAHYKRASATYAAAERRLRQATKPLDLLELSNDLDLAVWELDCAEALLDGKPKPAKPEPRRPAPVPEPAPRPAPQGGYTRRPTRRSSALNPDMLNAILMAGAAVAASRSRGRRPARDTRATTRSTRSGGSRGRSSSSRRMRGGRRRRR